MAEKLYEELFPGITFSNLLKDIYDNSKKKSNQIDILINELRPLIKDISQAVAVVPLIKEYLEVAVKNDEQLVKMAAVYQKFAAVEDKVKSISDELLTPEEKKQLLTEIKSLGNNTGDVKKSSEEIEMAFDKLNEKNQILKQAI